MFTQIGNTSIGGGYVYQWWLSALMYYLLIKKKSIRLKGEADFNKKVNGLLKHFGGSLGPYKIEHKNLYLEGTDEGFEDINLLKKTTGGVWYGFIQSKTTQDSEYGTLTEIRKIIKRFFRNIHLSDGLKCSFVIASNVKINASLKKKIEENHTDFKLLLLPSIIGVEKICNELDLPAFLQAIKDNDEKKMEILLVDDISLDLFLDSYNRLSAIITSIYFFDDISPKNIITSIDSLNKRMKKEEILFHTIYKATRRKILDPSDDDYEIYDQFPDTKFGGNLKTDIINGGFLLLGN